MRAKGAVDGDGFVAQQRADLLQEVSQARQVGHGVDLDFFAADDALLLCARFVVKLTVVRVRQVFV